MDRQHATHKIAGQFISMPCNFIYLEPCRIFEKVEPTRSPVYLQHSEIITTGWVGGRIRRVKVNVSETGAQIEVEEGGGYFIRPEKMEISALDSVGGDPEHTGSLSHEVMLGLALVFALATRNVWCLHASAAKFHDTVMVFLGESGRGKSTLAAYLSQQHGWQRVADDMLPVELFQGRVHVLPHFPQLKIPPTVQPCSYLPERLSLTKVVLLEPAGNDATPAIQKIKGSEALSVLLAHTAGTRMFTPDLMQNHLSFCSDATAAIDVYKMNYPHNREALPGVKELLQTL